MDSADDTLRPDLSSDSESWFYEALIVTTRLNMTYSLTQSAEPSVKGSPPQLTWSLILTATMSAVHSFQHGNGLSIRLFTVTDTVRITDCDKLTTAGGARAEGCSAEGV